MKGIKEFISDLLKIAAAEGTVLLKNCNNLLPLKANTKLAVFGRAQNGYYYTGTGSGGGVGITSKISIIDSLKQNSDLTIDEELAEIYSNWVKENPFDDGGGVWAGEPWSQKEMPLSSELASKASLKNDVALIIIGRSAGEDHDNADEAGSFRLTGDEETVLNNVTKYFKNVIVALNTGNLIDISFLDRYEISSLLYLWQSGLEGANAFSEILSGRLYPSGKLTDTQAVCAADYPSTPGFSDDSNDIFYSEDIYVGYRYFETFDKFKVRYPFGFGMGYTTFSIKYREYQESNTVIIEALVKNTGKNTGKETVQIYFGSPCGELGTPERQLIAFTKTKELKPGQEQKLVIAFNKNMMASYDDSGITGNKSCYVLQAGDYDIFAGTDVRIAKKILTVNVGKTIVTESLSEECAPRKSFKCLRAVQTSNGRKAVKCDVSLGTSDENKKRSERLRQDIKFCGDKGIKLKDVYENKDTLEDFISQIPDDLLARLVCGEGMSSPKATPGAGGAIGGLTEELFYYGIPVCSVTDGPNGIRITTDKQLTILPCGTALASTWNEKLVCELYKHIGEQLKEFEVDALLGPGLNIHRNPLCGRNFEYYSEDPYLSGRMALAVSEGISLSGSYSVLKHFCCNNREKSRSFYDVNISERALREIYLKPFEMAIKEGKNVLVMTSYNKVNGYYSASNYELCNEILKKEWNFKGLVMTDWWANCNSERFKWGSKDNLSAMIKAQNDLYMVCKDQRVKSASIIEGLNNGTIELSELQACAYRILKWILNTNSFKRYLEAGCENKYPLTISTDGLNEVFAIEKPISKTPYDIEIKSGKSTVLALDVICDADSLSQITLNVKLDNINFPIIVSGDKSGKPVRILRATDSEWVKEHKITFDYPEIIKIEKISLMQ